MTTKYILAKPEIVDRVGKIYPIKVAEYDEFEKSAGILGLGKKHFRLEDEDINKYSLLDLIMSLPDDEMNIIETLEKLFLLVCRKDFKFTNQGNSYAFISKDNKSYINKKNYDKVREIVMKQNLIFEPKVYKSKLVQEWADKVKKARAKKGDKITVEDMISTVSAFTGKLHENIANMSIYQLYSDYRRIEKIKDFDSVILFRSQGAKAEVNYFGGYINMFQSPDDDIFVKKDKLNKMNDAIK